jgi:hypothetical protein
MGRGSLRVTSVRHFGCEEDQEHCSTVKKSSIVVYVFFLSKKKEALIVFEGQKERARKGRLPAQAVLVAVAGGKGSSVTVKAKALLFLLLKILWEYDDVVCTHTKQALKDKCHILSPVVVMVMHLSLPGPFQFLLVEGQILPLQDSTKNSYGSLVEGSNVNPF